METMLYYDRAEVGDLWLCMQVDLRYQADAQGLRDEDVVPVEEYDFGREPRVVQMVYKEADLLHLLKTLQVVVIE